MEAHSLLRQLHSTLMLNTFDAFPCANTAKQGEIRWIYLRVIIFHTQNSQKHFVFTVWNANAASENLGYVSKPMILVCRNQREFSRHCVSGQTLRAELPDCGILEKELKCLKQKDS